jgi:shikimate kinase
LFRSKRINDFNDFQKYLMKVFLVGFMGSGKSYRGQELALALGFDFVDTDTVIENLEGASVSSIFSQKGETYFRELEAKTLRNIAKWDNIVVATGGGMPCFHDNMTFMNQNGLTIYLETPTDLLLQRLIPEVENRPLLHGKSEPELRDFIEEKIKERAVFYALAKVTVVQQSNTDDFIAQVLKNIAA